MLPSAKFNRISVGFKVQNIREGSRSTAKPTATSDFISQGNKIAGNTSEAALVYGREEKKKAKNKDNLRLRLENVIWLKYMHEPTCA